MPAWSPRCCCAAACRAARPPRRRCATRRSATRDPRIVYHGRVIREGGWVVLHYLFFYAMNDWRSTFDGANDHEADLEQCFVVLEALDDGSMQPAWFCAAAHDEKGDDLRRRWDDPRMETIDGHPVVYPGPARTRPTSSAASTSCCCRSPASGTSAGRSTSSGGSGATRSPSRTRATSPAEAKRALSVPFVDYARGDGLVVGPGGDVEWTPIVISDEDGWVDRYRGLWGLDTGDRFAGERAPAGPKYTRTGSVRQSWHDPLGFAGLGKVAPPSQAIPVLEARIAELAATQGRGRRRGRVRWRVSLPKLDAEVAAVRGYRGPGRLSGGTTARAARRGGAADQPARPGGRARHRDRRRPRAAGGPGGRTARRSANPPSPRLGTRTAVRRAAAGVRRSVGRRSASGC